MVSMELLAKNRDSFLKILNQVDRRESARLPGDGKPKPDATQPQSTQPAPARPQAQNSNDEEFYDISKIKVEPNILTPELKNHSIKISCKIANGVKNIGLVTRTGKINPDYDILFYDAYLLYEELSGLSVEVKKVCQNYK